MKFFCPALIFLLCLAAPVGAQPNWAHKPIDTIGDVGSDISLAVDSHGVPHVAYADKTNGTLVYAYSLGGTWHATDVDLSIPFFITLVMDQSDRPQILYQATDYTNHCPLRFASFDGANWQIETLDTPSSFSLGCWRFFPSLDIDSTDRPNVCFMKYNPTGVMTVNYGVKSASVWSFEAVDTTTANNPGEFTDIQVDTPNSPHILYDRDFALKYAHKSGSTWTRENVGTYGIYSSLELPNGNTPHIASQNDNTGNLEYRVRIGPNAWFTNIIGSMARHHGPAQLQVEPSLQPHAVFTAAGTQRLIYATKPTATWVLEEVDLTRTVDWSSFVLFNQKAPRVAYYASATGDAYYATRTDVTGVGTEPVPLRCDLAAYPNPFNPEVTLDYRVPVGSVVSLSVCDVSGKLVDTLIDRQTARAASVRLSYQPHMPSGVYFIRLQAAGDTVTRKLVLLK